MAAAPGNLVDGDNRNVCFGVALNGYDRHAHGQVTQCFVRRREGRYHRQPFDGLAHEPAHSLAYRLAVQRVDGHDRHEVTVLLRCLLDPEESRDRAIKAGVGAITPRVLERPLARARAAVLG